MCIRDRAYTEIVQNGKYVSKKVRDIIFNSYISNTSKNPLNCLLYTSDAADERSSVDLGGRRIIKKKQN